MSVPAFFFALALACRPSASAQQPPLSVEDIPLLPLPAPSPSSDDNMDYTTQQNPALIDALFRRSNIARVSLSPDGKYLAYVTKPPSPKIVVVKTDALSEVVSIKNLPPNPASFSNAPVPLTWLGWIAPARLVAAVGMPFRDFTGLATGEIAAMNADGSGNTVLLKPGDVQKVGFLSNAEMPPMRYVARDTGWMSTGFTADRGLPSSRAERALNGGGFEMGMGRAALPPAREQPPRSISVIGYCDDDPQSILVRAQSLLAYGIYKLNVITGKHSSLSEQYPPAVTNVLLDRRGRVAVEQPATNDKRFPHAYRYVGNAARKTTLDKLISLRFATGATAPTVNRKPETENSAAFSVSPENVFGERSIPLGFDTDPAILYYASNVGRDTYAIYAANLKTGAPVPLLGSAGVPPADEGRLDPRPIENPKSKIQNPPAPTGLAIEDATRDLFIPPVTGFPAQSPLIWNRHTGKLAGVVVEGSSRTTRWLNPAFQNLQSALEQRLPGRAVSVLEWSADETKFLIYADGPADPGSYYIYDAPAKVLTAFASLSAGLNERTMPLVSEINLTTPAGVRLTGVLTMPPKFQTKTISMIILCPPTPWTRRALDYNPEVLMLASLGYMIVELNSRGAPGYGLKNRQTAAIGGTPTITYVEDVLTIIGELSKHFPINQKRISLIGEKYGGYIALRALQLHGDRFSCAVAIDAPVDPRRWLADIRATTGESEPLLCAACYDTPQEMKNAPLINHTELIKKPVYLLNSQVTPLVDERDRPITRPDENKYDDARRVADWIKKDGGYALFAPINNRSRRVLLTNAENFIRAIQTNTNIILGPMREVKGALPPRRPR